MEDDFIAIMLDSSYSKSMSSVLGLEIARRCFYELHDVWAKYDLDTERLHSALGNGPKSDAVRQHFSFEELG